MSDIIYRELLKEDIQDICAIIDQTWDMNKYTDDQKTAEGLLEVYLTSYLVRSNFEEVAVLDGKVVGVILGRNESTFIDKDSEHYDIMEAFKKKGFPITEKENIASKYISRIDDADRQMLNKHVGEFDAELNLFIVDGEYRGMGIGKRLFADFIRFLKYNGAKNLYLFTDDFCNVEFYVHIGYKMRERIEVHSKEFDEKGYFYLFSKEF